MPKFLSCVVIVLQNTIHETNHRCSINSDCVCEYSITQVIPQFSIKCSDNTSITCNCLACEIKTEISQCSGCSNVCCAIEIVVKNNKIIYDYCSIEFRILENYAIEVGVVNMIGIDVLNRMVNDLSNKFLGRIKKYVCDNIVLNSKYEGHISKKQHDSLRCDMYKSIPRVDAELLNETMKIGTKWKEMEKKNVPFNKKNKSFQFSQIIPFLDENFVIEGGNIGMSNGKIIMTIAVENGVSESSDECIFLCNSVYPLHVTIWLRDENEHVPMQVKNSMKLRYWNSKNTAPPSITITKPSKRERESNKIHHFCTEMYNELCFPRCISNFLFHRNIHYKSTNSSEASIAKIVSTGHWKYLQQITVNEQYAMFMLIGSNNSEDVVNSLKKCKKMKTSKRQENVEHDVALDYLRDEMFAICLGFRPCMCFLFDLCTDAIISICKTACESFFHYNITFELIKKIEYIDSILKSDVIDISNMDFGILTRQSWEVLLPSLQMHKHLKYTLMSEIICSVMHQIFFGGAFFTFCVQKSKLEIMPNTSNLNDIKSEVIHRMGAYVKDTWDETRFRNTMHILIQNTRVFHSKKYRNQIYKLREIVMNHQTPTRQNLEKSVYSKTDALHVIAKFVNLSQKRNIYNIEEIGDDHLSYSIEMMKFFQNFSMCANDSFYHSMHVETEDYFCARRALKCKVNEQLHLFLQSR